MTDNQNLEAQLRSLTQEFLSGLPEVWGGIESTWAHIWRAGLDAQGVERLIQQVHALAGSAGSLGFERMTRAASELQFALQHPRRNGTAERAEQMLSRTDTAFQALRQAVYTDRQIDLKELTERLGAARAVSTSLLEKRANRLVYLVEDDPIQAAELAAQVGYFGYTVQIFHNPSEIEAAVHRAMPTAILMDVTFPEGRMAGYDIVSDLGTKIPDLPPVIFVSVNDRMPFRLQAVRVGGKAYFTKPVEVGALVDVLDRLIFHEIVTPYRILIVDDSRVQANYTAIQLKKVGITTEIVSDPMQVIDSMISFNPELLLLDMYMPDCTGMELAKVIRQMEQFISVPIVFLSAETDKEKQLAAMELGGDDFLTKPIEPNHLIAAVTTRIERYRKLREFMIHDGLTGLLNHSTTKERLAQETELARRQNQSLSFAMLDLDLFKRVNDTYGHATGDRVLKSLAHLLSQRLRSSDTIGRFGGEEFAVILPNTDEKTAVKIMQELCDGFAKIHHYFGEKEFAVSFSCGVATFPECSNAETLTRTADLALYTAKSAGRSRVMGASDCKGSTFPILMQAHPLVDPVHGLSQAAIYQNLVKQANSLILRIDRQANITFANEYALRFFGFSEEEMLGRNAVGTIVASTDTQGTDMKAMLTSIVEHPERYVHHENENIRKNGERVWVIWSNTPLLDEKGELAEILCIGNDISDRKRTEAGLTRTVDRLSALNRISQAVMVEHDLPKILDATAREIIDLFHAQNVGVALLNQDGSALETIGNFRQGWKEYGATGDLIVLQDNQASREVIQSGKAVFVPNAAVSPLTRGNHAALSASRTSGVLIVPLIVRGKSTGTMRIDFDNPDRRMYSTELELAETIAGTIAGLIENSRLFSAEQRQRQYFEALVHNIPTAVEMVDLNSRVTSWNPAAEKLFGYTAEEAIGQNIDELLSSEEYRQEAMQYTQATLNSNDPIHSITQRRRKDGSLADVELLAVPVILDGVQLGGMAIYHDVTELQRARREAEAANEAKSAFLATMSHEIRTPLNAIIGMTTLLLDTPLSDEQHEFSETIRNSSEALLTIINDILDFSKIEAGRMELEEQPFDLRECLESAFDLVASRATEKGIDLAYLLDPNVPSVIISDSTRLRQILLNLLSNSLKFTQQGEVVLLVSAEKTAPPENKAYLLHFAVRDTGIGIPPDRMERLFRSFSQVDASTTRKYGGTGLGLAISKRLAELMGGSMWVESEGVSGKGSIFHFTLLANPSSSPMPVFMHRKQPELAGKRALIVDDNATNRYILMRQVQSWGMLPQETAYPRQALQWVREGQSFDVALLDMQMPEMDGVTLAAEIQRFNQGKTSLPMVMLTSLGLKELDTAGVKFAAYLTKPIKPAALYTTLLDVFGPQAVATTNPTKTKPDLSGRAEPSTPLRILLAEDNVVNQKVALRLLERIGYRADVASNGLEVLDALRRQPYDVILMDVQMPEMDGLETTRHVRSGEWIEPGQDITLKYQPYIIAMTANAMQGDREVCLSAGMDDYVSKPIRVEEISRALRQVQPQRQTKNSSPRKPVPQSSGPLSDPALDEATFRKFHTSMGEEDPLTVASLIGDYLSDAPVLLEDLRQAAAQGDLEKMHRASHSLKSSSMLFGALRLAELCKTIELDARGGSLQRAAELITQAGGEFQAVKQALGQKIHSLQAG